MHHHHTPQKNLTASIGFGSDNHSGVHPEVMIALAQTNVGHQPSYGTDDVTIRAQKILRSHFGEQSEIFFVFNGTAANTLCLAGTLKPYQSVICSSHSHLHNDECGAPERVAGVKLIPVPSANAKLRPEQIEAAIIRRGDQHFSQIAMISVTQPTELGTVYSIEELLQLRQVANHHGLLFHMDGARLVNAAASLGVSLKALTQTVGVDILSLGGTKNALMFGEAVVFLNPLLAKQLKDEFKYVRKQLMQLPSKTRFVAAQFEALLGGDLWLRNSRHANQMAQLLVQGLTKRSFVEVTQIVQANAVFVKIPKHLIGPLRDEYFFYVWDQTTFECRLMTTWDTTPEAVEGFLQHLDRIYPIVAKDFEAKYFATMGFTLR